MQLNVDTRHGSGVEDRLSCWSGIGDSVDDDFLRRLGNVETAISELRAEVRAISATIPYLATKADLKAEIGEVRAEIAGVIGSAGSLAQRPAR